MTKEELRNFMYVSLISADNESLSEEEKQEIITRRRSNPNDWEYILEPIKDEKLRQNSIELLKSLD